MNRLTDEELIAELKERFAFNLKALDDLREMTGKLEEMNTKLQESESVKGHFLSNIRNEINNPLTSIMGLSTQFMGNKQCDPERCADISRMIYLEAFHLDFQLQNIFMAAELEAGEAEPAFSRVDILRIVDRERLLTIAKSEVEFSFGNIDAYELQKRIIFLLHLCPILVKYELTRRRLQRRFGFNK